MHFVVCFRNCFKIGLNHQHLYKSVVAALPDAAPMVRGPTEASPTTCELDTFTEVIGLVAFLIGASMLDVGLSGLTIRGMEVELDVNGPQQLVASLRP